MNKKEDKQAIYIGSYKAKINICTSDFTFSMKTIQYQSWERDYSSYHSYGKVGEHKEEYIFTNIQGLRRRGREIVLILEKGKEATIILSDEKDGANFLKQAHKNGIKVVLDNPRTPK